MAATTGSSESSAYAASKAGVRAMCRSLAGELSPRGIRVNAVIPGVIETPIWERIAVPPEAAAARERRLQAMIPLNRVGRAEDIASNACDGHKCKPCTGTPIRFGDFLIDFVLAFRRRVCSATSFERPVRVG
jgi:NAD(P)-dependent dehydrogenase (short-subunit alcohol dehydrogenase family)